MSKKMLKIGKNTKEYCSDFFKTTVQMSKITKIKPVEQL